MPIHLVIGLGNPGTQYRGTRHNLGFEVLDRYAGEYGLEFRKKKESLVAEAPHPQDGELLFVKPQTFMNLSGDVLAEYRNKHWYKDPASLLVVFDDAALPVGQIRIRTGGSAGGHNGMKSIIERLGNDRFPRLRVGIGAPPPNLALEDYVLKGFAPAERAQIEETLPRAVEALRAALTDGVEAAMNRYNQRAAS